MARTRTAIALLVAALLAAALLAAAPATGRPPAEVAKPQGDAAKPQGESVRLWSISKVRRGLGAVPVTLGGQVGDVLDKTVDLGFSAFTFPESFDANRAVGHVFSSADGKRYSVMAQAPSANPAEAQTQTGGVVHLDELQAYEKRTGDASLKVTITEALLDVIDANHQPSQVECPIPVSCLPIRASVRFHVRAYTPSAIGGDFFNIGGTAFIEGFQGHWRFDAVSSSDSRRPLWSFDDFSWIVDPTDPDGLDPGAEEVGTLNDRRTIRVPLGPVPDGELFALDVSLDATAVDARGRESAAEALITDPQEGGSPLIATRGLRPLGRPHFKAPRPELPPQGRCAPGVPGRAGSLQFSQAGFAADESSGPPMLLVTRTGGTRGSASAEISTSGGSARSGIDFGATHTRVHFAAGDDSPRLVEVPIREDVQLEPPEVFRVRLGHVRCAERGEQRRASVTILDDDAEPPTPAGFSVGGSVDGLEGSGLVLTDHGTDLAVTGNGAFTFPQPRAAGLPYDVQVTTQPHGPGQSCTVEHGSGTVTADVTDILVHCITPVPPTGLDPSFGGDGRVSVPVGAEGEGEAVVIQPDGRIVTAGRTTTPTGVDFALTRLDSSGALDPTFGGDGVVSTDLGTADDQAFDAALLPGGGTVAVGRTLTAPVNGDVALVAYAPNGTPDPAFGGDGVVTTDVFGSGDQANAVAVQPDGKIVIAGFAASGVLVDGDFLVARYLPDGTLDTTFGDDGIVTTDLGSREDDGRALVIQPDGAIVVVGTVGDDVALARYTADGDLDATFGDAGIRISDLGSDDIATGAALTADGRILVAGTTLGADVNRAFLVARYTAGGDLDGSFGDGGTVTTDLGDGDDFAENLLVDATGRVVLVGRATSSTILDMALVRYLPDGTLDGTFDGDGILTADISGIGDFGQDLAIDADGRIVAAGFAGKEFGLVRAFA